MASASYIFQAAERFHLVFLSQFGAVIDKRLYALKDGCNLRFFLKSIRYSEDIDFDVHTIAKATVQKNVDRVLAGAPLTTLLSQAGIELGQVSRPKQTDTTQRWKVKLRTESGEVGTRIEFSRRRFDRGSLFEAVDPEITGVYKLRPVLANHYSLETALRQKIDALALRSQTQARDVFDIAFLLDRGAQGNRIEPKKKAAAGENALSVSRDQFIAQVVVFLPAEYQEYYSSRKAWESLQEKVLTHLER